MSNRVHQVLDVQAQRLDRATVRLMRPADGVRRHTQRLSLLAHRLGGAAGEVVRRQSLRHDTLAARLTRAQGVALASAGVRLQSLASRLDGLDPARVLARGYAWLETDGGRAVTSAASLAPGQIVRAVLADGAATAEVRDVSMKPADDR
jgi:exodeoxyribonuclease VII large subunit